MPLRSSRLEKHARYFSGVFGGKVEALLPGEKDIFLSSFTRVTDPDRHDR